MKADAGSPARESEQESLPPWRKKAANLGFRFSTIVLPPDREAETNVEDDTMLAQALAWTATAYEAKATATADKLRRMSVAMSDRAGTPPWVKDNKGKPKDEPRSRP